MATAFAGKGKVEISRFKGLGEMPPAQLAKPPWIRRQRTLLARHAAGPDGRGRPREPRTSQLVESLMGRKPELRFHFIQEHAQFVRDLDV